MPKPDVPARRASAAVLRYGLAVLSVAVALIVTLLLHPDALVAPVFFLPIILSAWFGGTGPGLLAARAGARGGRGGLPAQTIQRGSPAQCGSGSPLACPSTQNLPSARLLSAIRSSRPSKLGYLPSGHPQWGYVRRRSAACAYGVLRHRRPHS